MLVITGLIQSDVHRLKSVIATTATVRDDLDRSFPDEFKAAAPCDAKLLLGYSDPQVAVIEAVLQGRASAMALAQWRDRAAVFLEYQKERPEQCALVDVGVATANPNAVIAQINDCLNLSNPIAACEPPADTGILHCLSDALGRPEDSATQLLVALREASICAISRCRNGAHRDQVTDWGDEDAVRLTGQDNLEAQNWALRVALDMCTSDLEETVKACNRLERSVARQRRGLRAQLSRLIAKLQQRRNRRLIEESEFFDADWYRKRNPDVGARENAALHYLVHGGAEGRPAGPNFSSSAYLEMNPDIQALGINPLVHFLRRGRAEGRPAMSVHGRPIK